MIWEPFYVFLVYHQFEIYHQISTSRNCYRNFLTIFLCWPLRSKRYEGVDGLFRNLNLLRENEALLIQIEILANFPEYRLVKTMLPFEKFERLGTTLIDKVNQIPCSFILKISLFCWEALLSHICEGYSFFTKRHILIDKPESQPMYELVSKYHFRS